MGIRIFSNPKGIDNHELTRTEYEDSSFEQRESTVDGYTFHWGPNETRNFLDDGVGLAHGAFRDNDSDAIATDAVPFGSFES